MLQRRKKSESMVNSESQDQIQKLPAIVNDQQNSPAFYFLLFTFYFSLSQVVTRHTHQNLQVTLR